VTDRYDAATLAATPEREPESLDGVEDRPGEDALLSTVRLEEHFEAGGSGQGQAGTSGGPSDRSRVEAQVDRSVADLQSGEGRDYDVAPHEWAVQQQSQAPYARGDSTAADDHVAGEVQQQSQAPYARGSTRSAADPANGGFGYYYFESMGGNTPPAVALSDSGGFPIDADGDGTIDLSNGTLMYRQYFDQTHLGMVPAETVQGIMAGAAIESAEREYRELHRNFSVSNRGGPAESAPDASGLSRLVIAPLAPFAEGQVVEQLLDNSDFSRMDDVLAERESGFGVVQQNEWYAPLIENSFVSPLDEPLSTFSTDVDTAAFTNVRRFIDAGLWPPADAVRIEELVNYFDYTLAAPADEHPIAVSAEAAACPWKPEHRLARVTIQARDIAVDDRPPTTLVFLTDVSGSMREDNKLPLVQQSLKLLTAELTENDRVALVTYADEARLELDSTPGDQHEVITAAIDALQADGSTNGAGGLTLAYDVARRHFVDHGTNRVILCSDGDFNVGISDDDALVQLIEEQRRSGVFLSVFGFGAGNLKDAKLEGLADHGNGHYGYVDSLDEARRVFVEQITGTLYTVARDVKLQVDFNPLKVAAYRLIGYENRALENTEFDADAVDAGDLGAGQSATALYELTLRSVSDEQEAAVLGKCLEQRSARFGLAQEQQVALRRAREKVTIEGEVITELSKEDVGRAVEALYGVPQQQSRFRIENRLSVVNDSHTVDAGVPLDDLLTIRVRYKRPTADESRLLEVPLVDAGHQQVPSDDFAWSSAVASFGLLLRQSPYSGLATFDSVVETAAAARGEDPSGRRREFIDMVRRARAIWESAHGSAAPRPIELSSTVAREKAASGGTYDVLLDKLTVPEDLTAYGSFHEFGWWSGTEYRGRTGLPAGYWVYVYPDWYIWQERRTP
jgi:Ca-activated chloride channel family protein